MKRLLLLLIPFAWACQDPAVPVENNWPPVLEGWTITPLAIPTGSIQNELIFFDDQNGLVYGKGLWYTEDGGQSWQDRSPATGDYTIDVASFYAPREGIICYHIGEVGEPDLEIYLATTRDGGRNWQSVLMDVFQTPPADMLFLDGFDGYAIEFGSTGNLLLRTQDGGASWDEMSGVNPKISGFPGRADNQSIYFRSPQQGFVLSADGDSWYETEDGGDNWVSRSIGAFAPRSFQFAGNDSVYFLAERLYLSTNGGRTADLLSQDIFNSFIALEDGSLLAMRYKRFDGSNPAQPLNYYSLSWLEAGNSSWQHSQEVVNYFFETLIEPVPGTVYGLAFDQQTGSYTLYRLQR